MASQVHSPETAEIDSVCSTPRSDHHSRWNDELLQPPPRVRFMCSFGGRILPRPHDNQLRYVGGETRIVAVHRSTTFAALLAKLGKLSGSADFTVKYQLPTEDLDALISVSTDEDVDNMMEEYDRLCISLCAAAARTPRLRLFLFPHGGSRSSSISSLLDGVGAGSSKQWFLDALNGSGGASLERVRSEVSSVVSEVPDYLFGLDNESSETATTKGRSRVFHGRAGGGTGLGGGGNGLINSDQAMSVVTDPGSPAPPDVAPSPYCSTSSTTLMPPADLPRVKTKLEPAMIMNVGQGGGERSVDDHDANHDRFNDVEQQPPGLQAQHTSTGYNPNVPIMMWPPPQQQQQKHYYPETHLQGQAVQQVPVYYLPAAGNVPVRPVQMPVPSYCMQGVAGQPALYGGQPMMVNPMGAPPAAAPVYGGQILHPGEIRPISTVEQGSVHNFARAPPAATPAEAGQVLYGQRPAGVVPVYAPAGAVPAGLINGADPRNIHVVNTEVKRQFD